MAERQQERDVQLEFVFDRLVAAKLEQVYEILVPDQVRIVRAGADVTGGEDESRASTALPWPARPYALDGDAGLGRARGSSSSGHLATAKASAMRLRHAAVAA